MPQRTNPTRLKIRRPDDWHVHLRDGALLDMVVQHSARQFGRVLVMPNLVPPIRSAAEALAYRERILRALAPEARLQPMMTLYLTDETEPRDIIDAKMTGVIPAAKLYPAGATTNSQFGVTHLRRLYGVLETMQEHGLVLCVHGEVVDDAIDIFDREKVFIDQVLKPLTQDFPALRIVFEHITTRDAVEFVESAPDNVAATITPHHLLYDRNHMLVGGLRPHLYCLPILKRSNHREALIKAATSGNPRFFLGSDSAPHPRHKKESACGCAGIYSAHAAIEFYAEVFEQENALDKLEGFASEFGARFYGLPLNQDYIVLEKTSWKIPAALHFDEHVVVPLKADEYVAWKLGDEI
ncbi:MAG: dihydroorotase [Gammaproteobacteria bacterium]|nr:MAG: dihydroorotase [Gammaproteobacteria bacterium]